MQTLIKAVLFFCFIPLTVNLVADEKQELAQIQKQLEKNVPNMKVEMVTKSVMPGIYEVLSSGQLLYVSADAKFLISGKLFSIENGIKDLSQASMRVIDMRMDPIRREKISAVDEKDMIVFKAADETHRITVFTDIDCAYCRKLHKDMGQYNALGITIQYMGFPRAGLGSPSHKKLQSVWCAADPVAAMNKAKNEGIFGNDTCDDPIPNHYKLVKEFGLNGTPAIILESGRHLPGYLDAKSLLQVIEEDEAMLAKTN